MAALDHIGGKFVSIRRVHEPDGVAITALASNLPPLKLSSDEWAELICLVSAVLAFSERRAQVDG